MSVLSVLSSPALFTDLGLFCLHLCHMVNLSMKYRATDASAMSGVCEVRWGANGECGASAEAGDFIDVPAFLPHMEINPSDSQPFRWVVVRSTSTPIVVNLPEDTWRSFSDVRSVASG